MAYKIYKPLRLKDYDYSQPGAYFITICTYKRFYYFGDIKKEKMVLTEKGIIAQNEILEIPKHYENVDVGEYVVMPNHVHLVVYMFDLFGVGQAATPTNSGVGPKGVNKAATPTNSGVGPKGVNKAATPTNSGVGQAMTPAKSTRLQDIVGSYKSAVTREIGKNNKFKAFKWQRYFHDHIIRNDKALENISDYIRMNPVKWAEDIENEKYLSGLSETARKNKAKILYKNLTI